MSGEALTRKFFAALGILFFLGIASAEAESANLPRLGEAPLTASGKAKAFFSSLEMREDGVHLTMRDGARPTYASDCFVDGELFIGKKADLSRHRLKALPEDETLKGCAFILYQASGEEDETWLYLKEIRGDEAVFILKGNNAGGDGSSHPFLEEFVIKKTGESRSGQEPPVRA
jgi:hypothetical protein